MSQEFLMLIIQILLICRTTSGRIKAKACREAARLARDEEDEARDLVKRAGALHWARNPHPSEGRYLGKVFRLHLSTS